jgi:hypothetical protein
MPLPADVWESCKRAQAQAQALPGDRQQAGAAQQVQSQPSQWQGGGAGDGEESDDEYCLQLLDQLDQQRQATAAQQ